jgi:3-deoxy-D-manno-octulosonic-acid transferase
MCIFPTLILKLSVIATQNQNSAERFIKLGANKDKVMVAGNIKFEQNPSANKNQTFGQISVSNNRHKSGCIFLR